MSSRNEQHTGDPAGRPSTRAGRWSLTIQEPDYRFGRGVLRIRVDRIDLERPMSYDGEIWFQVHGVQLTATGEEITPRQVWVRARALPPRKPT